MQLALKYHPDKNPGDAEAIEKFKYYRSLGSIDGALALFGGWTGIDLDKYEEDEELRHVQSNAIR